MEQGYFETHRDPQNVPEFGLEFRDLRLEIHVRGSKRGALRNRDGGTCTALLEHSEI